MGEPALSSQLNSVSFLGTREMLTFLGEKGDIDHFQKLLWGHENQARAGSPHHKGWSSEGIPSAAGDGFPPDLQIYLDEFFRSPPDLTPTPEPFLRDLPQHLCLLFPDTPSPHQILTFPTTSGTRVKDEWVLSVAQKAFYQVYCLCQTLGFACDYPPSEWRTKGKNQQIIPMLPHHISQHRTGCWGVGESRGSLGHRPAVRGSQMRPEIEDSGQWSPNCSSGAPVAFLRHPRGSLEPAISCLASITQLYRDWDHTVTQDT